MSDKLLGRLTIETDDGTHSYLITDVKYKDIKTTNHTSWNVETSELSGSFEIECETEIGEPPATLDVENMTNAEIIEFCRKYNVVVIDGRVYDRDCFDVRIERNE